MKGAGWSLAKLWLTWQLWGNLANPLLAQGCSGTGGLWPCTRRRCKHKHTETNFCASKFTITHLHRCRDCRGPTPTALRGKWLTFMVRDTVCLCGTTRSHFCGVSKAVRNHYEAIKGDSREPVIAQKCGRLSTNSWSLTHVLVGCMFVSVSYKVIKSVMAWSPLTETRM